MEEISVVSDRRCIVGEGPHWDSATKRLIYVDILSGTVSRLDPETREEDTIYLKDCHVSLAVPSALDSDELIISRNKQLCLLKWQTEEVIVLGEVEPGAHTRFNDGKCDCKGRLWAGTMPLGKGYLEFYDDIGHLYSLDWRNNVRHHKGGLRISNGIAWNSTNKKMFFIDSLPRKIYVFDFDEEEGNITNEKKVIDFNDNPLCSEFGLPDGMTIDENDNLWVACFGGSRILNIDSRTGIILKTVTLPVSNITSCTFGGENYNTLFVTSAATALDSGAISHPSAGAVFKVNGLQTKGLPPNRFQTSMPKSDNYDNLEK